MKFDQLINEIEHTYLSLQQQAVKAINKTLTLRNWLIGFYIVEFEQNGEEMAKYGESLLENLAAKLDQASLSFRNLKLFRQFYQVYPQIGQTLSAQLLQFGSGFSYRQLHLFRQFFRTFPIVNALRSQFRWTHYRTLIRIENEDKRAFYIAETDKNNWTARQLERQVNSRLFERVSISQQAVAKLPVSVYSKGFCLFINTINIIIYIMFFLNKI